MARRGRLLYRVVLSHLMVAVPPAVVLGLAVRDINRSALELEAQHLHLAVAGRVRDGLRTDLDAKVRILEEAERILDMSELPIERRKELLTALVANGRIPHLAIHLDDGRFDTVLRARAGGDADRSAIPPAIASELAKSPFALGDAALDGPRREARLIVPWKRDGEVFGYLATAFELEPLSALASEKAARDLGEGGQVDVVDGARRYLASSRSELVGTAAGAGTPFEGLAGAGKRSGMAAVDVGATSVFTTPGGERRFGAIASDPDVRWIVAASRPEAVAFASLERVRERVFLAAAGAALVAGLFGLLLARHVSEPVRKLTRAVRASMKGGFGDTVNVRARTEVGDLAQAFNEAIRELGRFRLEVREQAQLRLRLSRFLPPSMLHNVLLKEKDVRTAGQQQIATVVYADVAAQARAAMRASAEDLVAILGEFFAAACSAVERHGGKVDRYSGDAVIGIFASRDLPDHAGRALQASVDVLAGSAAVSARWGEGSGAGFAAAIGIATGSAVVGAASDGSGEVSVAGTVVDDAAALQASAAAGTIAADRGTRELIPSTSVAWQRPSTAISREVFVLKPAATTTPGGPR